VNALVDPALTSINPASGFPTCYQPGGWGTNAVAWASTTNVPPGSPTGSQSENVTVTNYSSGDAKLLPTLDLGACTPTVVPGSTYNISVQYESTAISQFALYYRTTSGSWAYWTSSPWIAASSTWTTTTFTTPAVPAGANGVSFGLALIANGTLTTDNYSFVLPLAGAALVSRPTGGGTPVSAEKLRMHSHLKLLIPKLKPGQQFALEEFNGPHVRQPG
jgi:hypothetical protein